MQNDGGYCAIYVGHMKRWKSLLDIKNQRTTVEWQNEVGGERMTAKHQEIQQQKNLGIINKIFALL